MLQVEQMIGSLRHQEVEVQVYRFAGKLACLHASGPTRRQNRCPRDPQRFYCALTGIIQHIDLDIPFKHATSHHAKSKPACGCAGISITASRFGVIYIKLDFGLDFEQAQSSGPRNCFGPVMNIQFHENMVNMAFDRPDSDHELLCNLMV